MITITIRQEVPSPIVLFIGWKRSQSRSFNKVRVHEKKACESHTEKQEPLKDKTNLCVQSDETAGAMRPPNKRRKSILIQPQIRISRLAAKLVKEAFFGKGILAQSTLLGFQNLKPLDPTGLAIIKATIKNLCVWSNPVEFESI